jgi:hypothetical protein
MAYRPISCFEDPVEARWGAVMRGRSEDAEEHERDARRARYFERLGEVGLSRPLFETADDVDGFVAELVAGIRGPGA